jgi:protein subunit release factor A
MIRFGEVEARVARLQTEMADPQAYADGERIKRLVAEHGAAKDEAASLFDRWEQAQLELERVEAAVDADA